MQSRLMVVATLCFGLLAGTAHAAPAGHKLECPASPPADWGLRTGQLNQVDVLSFKRGESIDEKAPPSLMPDKQSVRSGVLHQVWELGEMTSGGEVQQLWCRYAGSERILKLPETGLHRCEQTITHYSATSIDPRSQRMIFCD